ncbi:MAG: alanine:cation symporter family protein [Endomicrobium sp.]|nr:alanine:cation symporter family protein [Endomicrobium sp.]
MDSFTAVVGQLNSFAWAALPVFIIILLISMFTLKTNFIQKKLFRSRIDLYSTESGMVELCVINAQAKTRTPFRQELISSTVTFLDGVVYCPLTGLVVVITLLQSPSLKNNPDISGNYIIEMVFSQVPYIGVLLST